MFNVLRALQRVHSSEHNHGNFDERRQIFFLNASELKCLNCTQFAWTERRVLFQTCMAQARQCWNSTVCVVSGEVSTWVGYTVITKHLLELLCQFMSDYLDSQVKKFCFVKCSSSCLCKQSSVLPEFALLQIGLICISMPNYLITLSYFLVWNDSFHEFNSL